MTGSFGSEAGDAVEELLCAILELPPEEHGAALREACAAHAEHAPALRERYAMLQRTGLVAPAVGDRGDFPERLGDFQLVERLGGGGMGVVYRARQESLGRDVALKLIRPDQLYFPGARERFRRETEAVARLQHPNVVPIYTVGEEQGLPYFAMELVRGCTLAEALDVLGDREPDSLTGLDLGRAVGELAGSAPPGPGDGPFAGTWPGTCLRVLAPIADALQHCHERGIVHRDVKPSNIVLRPDGTAMLVDFGLTSVGGEERVTRSGTPIGTLHYMSPEQVRGEREVDGRTDVYSLGATLHEMLTLEPPFAGDHPLVVQRAILEGRPRPLRTRNRRLSADLETVCRHAMEPDRERRYPSARALARDLENVLALRPIEVQPPGVWLRGRRWVQRNPALAAALLLGLLLVVGAPTGFLLQQRSHARVLRGQVQQAQEEARTATTAMDLLTDVLLARELKSVGDPDPRLSQVLLQGRELLERREGAAREPLVRGRMHFVLGHVLLENGRFTEALGFLRSARAAYADLPAERDSGFRQTTLLDLGMCLTTLQATEEAEQVLREVLVASDPQDEVALRAKCHLSTLYFDLERSEESERLAREVLAALGDAVDPGDPDRAETRAAALVMLAQNEHRAGDAASSLEHADEALAILEEILPAAHTGIARARMTRAHALMALRRLPDAEAEFEGAIEILDRLSTEPSEVRGQALFNLAFVQKGLGRVEEALDSYLRAEEEFELTTGPDSLGVGHCRFQIGVTRGQMGDREGAAEELEAALEVFRREYGEGHSRTADAHYYLANDRLAAGEPGPALEHFALAADAYGGLEGGEALFLTTLTQVVRIGLEQGDLVRAGEASTRLLRALEERPDDPRRAQLLPLAIRAFEAGGREEELQRARALLSAPDSDGR